MNWLRELARRLRMLIHRRQFDADLEEEMRLHLELRQQEHLESGTGADDARAAAQRRFGNPTYCDTNSPSHERATTLPRMPETEPRPAIQS
jgi:hypothetical protein